MAEKVATMPISADDKRFQKNKWIFSISGIGRDMSYQLISAFLLTYIQFANTLTWEQFTFIGLFIGVAGRIWDAINDPMMGAIIEGSHMKFGKFKPWIMIGALSCGVVIMCIFGIQMFSGWGFVAFMCIMYLLWEATFTMNDIGYWSMLSSLSSKREQRNNVTMLT
ncbi:MAG: MFS transporter, partial [Clostridia bacterium]